MTTPAITRLTGAATAAVLLATLVGCSNDDADSTAKKKASSSESASTSQRISPTDLPTAPALAQQKGAVKDVTVGTCPAKKGRNTVKGKVENPTDRARDYVITISWITPRSDVVARGIATVKGLGAGESRTWRASGTIASDGSYSCTTQVLRGELRG